MQDLNLSLSYFTHPKTKRLIGLLGRGAEVLPLKLWAYCGTMHPQDGKLSGYSVQEIESILDWWGEKGKAVSGLLTVRYMDDVDGVLCVHDWLEHQGHLRAFKLKAKKAAEARWSKIYKENAPSNATGNAPSNAPSTSSSNALTCANERTNVANDASIPTVDELAAFGDCGLGIPRDYCEHYHAQKTIRNGWIANGKLIQWNLELPRWWSKDKSTWFQRSKLAKPERAERELPTVRAPQ
jgi:hypothetical protein